MRAILAKAGIKTHRVKIICCQCHTVLETVWSYHPGDSHSYCPSCSRKFKAKVEQLKARLQR